MVGLHSLVLPILVSSVFVFIVSSVVHMMMPWHKNDLKRLENQDAVMDALRPLNIPAGDYVMPHVADGKEARSAEYAEKLKKGPAVVMTVRPANMRMELGKPLAQWFGLVVIITVFSAYITGRALGTGTDYLHVFRIMGASAFMGYSFGLWPMSIWYGRSWSTTFKTTIDGLLYALVTAGTFGWLWPR